MKKNVKFLTHAAVLAALYVVLTYAQNIFWPGSTSMAIQFRLSEALCIFALFTPAAIPGLTLGCLLFNLSNAQALPLDWLVGTLATLGKFPLMSLLMPALWNAFLVGWELTKFLADRFTWPVFWLNALYVAIGEAAVLLVLGTALYFALTARGLDRKLFAGD